jgi:hypothetical protein
LRLSVRDHEEDGISVAKALASAGLPVVSEEQLAEALEYKSITAGEKYWPVRSLPRILELLSLKDIFPNWREDVKKEEEYLAAQPAPEKKPKRRSIRTHYTTAGAAGFAKSRIRQYPNRLCKQRLIAGSFNLEFLSVRSMKIFALQFSGTIRNRSTLYMSSNSN